MGCEAPPLFVFKPSPGKEANSDYDEYNAVEGQAEVSTWIKPGDQEQETNETQKAQQIGSVRRQLNFDAEPESEIDDASADHESLSGSDTPFSPERENYLGDQSNLDYLQSSEDSLSQDHFIVPDQEREILYNDIAPTHKHQACNEHEARKVATEDYWSGLFHDPSENLWETQCLNKETNLGGEANFTNVPNSQIRSDAHRRGGLEGWDYASAFEAVEIRLDDANEFLGKRFIYEANGVLDSAVREIRINAKDDEIITASSLSRLALFDLFLPDSVTTKLKSLINRVLKARRKQLTTLHEIKSVIV